MAVVLSEAGNHVEEIRGGAAITVTPLIPLRMAPTWALCEELKGWKMKLPSLTVLPDKKHGRIVVKGSATTQNCSSSHKTRDEENGLTQVHL